MSDGIYYQGIGIAAGEVQAKYFPSEKYTLEMTRDELALFYAGLRERLEHDCGHRQYHRGRRGTALE